MIVKTESSYKPITVTLENKLEVGLFFAMLDCPADKPLHTYAAEHGLIYYDTALHRKMWSQFRTIYKDNEDRQTTVKAIVEEEKTKGFFCSNCEEYTVLTLTTEKEIYSVKGKGVEIEAEIAICQRCGAKVFNEERDSRNLKRAYEKAKTSRNWHWQTTGEAIEETK